ncbi:MULTISPECIES: acyl-[ACP]--phospholipid O-acyltransferase [unclassified Neptuniibacter]|uniref:acyl-[ACP]--phospholipid O-acyltransferase n=1 Tax=unclassified Neptuniibacter TaxID=2630693 RepID=UPI000C4DA2F6|nr:MULTISPECIES: acyl-[ACP]--phospholipid O-acyltransferase [unclassified Neptuniibacter]MAY42117.1 acyl-[ACP]--phospholipid O-acyltransferase [Oceanospirillaceae bacterium]|tara:strand:+ start:6554 stop:9997 length:3444 start_codon:yes stop_codon:yes gene_type:complete
MKDLLKLKGFIAFIGVAFINAFVDLGHKIVIQNTLFKAYDGDTQILLTAIVNGLILLPFILLFTPSGFLADKYPKNRVMKYAAWGGVFITLLITACYYLGLFVPAFALTFILALQSAFYSPAKYGYIKELVGANNLSEGNAWVQAVTMVAILAGIVVFSFLFEFRLEGAAAMSPQESLQRCAPLGWLLVTGALIELYLAYQLPQLKEVDKNACFDKNAYLSGRSLKNNLGLLKSKRPVWLAIVGLSIFWSISQVMLAVFPAFAEEHLNQHNTFIIQGVMAFAGIGIMIGSMLAGRLSRHYINVGLIPVGAVGVAAGLIMLPQLESMWVQAFVFMLIGLFGALLCVPLNALVQFHADESETGKVLAGSNFIQNIFMLGFLGLTVLFAWNSVDGLWLLVLLAVLACMGAVFSIITLPQAFIKLLVMVLFRRKYNLQVLGFENLPEDGKGTLLLGNHISWLDWAMIQMACPRPIHFVMERSIYERWYLRWFLDIFKVIPISKGKSRQALEQVRDLISAGQVVCLFPEGAISHMGQLGEFRRGFEKACEGAEGVIVPFYMRGLWGSRFSRSTDKMKSIRRTGSKRDVIVAYGRPLPINSNAAEVKQKVFELSIKAWDEYTQSLETLPKAFIRTMKNADSGYAIADVDGGPLSHKKFLTATALFTKRIACTEGDNIGLLMPTSSAGAIANMASLMAGKTVVNMNFTAPIPSLLSALKQSDVKTIVTARRFVKKLKAKGIDTTELFAGREVLYMEDVKEGISKVEAIYTMMLVALLPTSVLQLWLCKKGDVDNTAAILFSSGSEGEPKGVMLSHRNIMANLRQTADVLNVRDDDCIMATLPLFHAFGLTVTCFMPLIEGMPVVCHPDPTDAPKIGKGVARYKATLMCATSTFLRLYTRNKRVHPLMFESLRAVVAGAEKLDNSVREAFEQKYHVAVVEGYGSTETTPVASTNLPDSLDTDWWTVQVGNKPGTVGMALPGSTFRIVDPDTLEELPIGEDGLILIGGTQIMQGYLNNPEKTAQVVVEIDGIRWYKSGDKGHLDEDGFLTIVDRYSRFAKLGGEMVSLTAIEGEVRKILQLPDLPLVAVNLPDPKKGEKVILLVEGNSAEGMRELLIKGGMPALMIPSAIHEIETLPILGSGKTNFSESRKMAELF